MSVSLSELVCVPKCACVCLCMCLSVPVCVCVNEGECRVSRPGSGSFEANVNTMPTKKTTTPTKESQRVKRQLINELRWQLLSCFS